MVFNGLIRDQAKLWEIMDLTAALQAREDWENITDIYMRKKKKENHEQKYDFVNFIMENSTARHLRSEPSV